MAADRRRQGPSVLFFAQPEYLKPPCLQSPCLPRIFGQPEYCAAYPLCRRQGPSVLFFGQPKYLKTHAYNPPVYQGSSGSPTTVLPMTPLPTSITSP
jgi:hypothetical protein